MALVLTVFQPSPLTLCFNSLWLLCSVRIPLQRWKVIDTFTCTLYFSSSTIPRKESFSFLWNNSVQSFRVWGMYIETQAPFLCLAFFWATPLTLLCFLDIQDSAFVPIVQMYYLFLGLVVVLVAVAKTVVFSLNFCIIWAQWKKNTFFFFKDRKCVYFLFYLRAETTFPDNLV